MARVAVGTSGWQYPEWKGLFYPEKISPKAMLPYYAERFATVEVNYTFRHLPTEKTIGGWTSAVPETFTFALKAPQRITHFARLKGADETAELFFRMARALGPRLGPLLFQLPPSFKKDLPRLRTFLAASAAAAQGLRIAFEFRHESWFDDEALGALRERGVSLCVATHDNGFRTPVVATAPGFVYLRLRESGYDDAEIDRWAERCQAFAAEGKDVFCYFKHENEALGPGFAQKLVERLGTR